MQINQKLFLAFSLTVAGAVLIAILISRSSQPNQRLPAGTFHQELASEEFILSELGDEKVLSPTKRYTMVLGPSSEVGKLAKDQVTFFNAHEEIVDIPFDIAEEDDLTKLVFDNSYPIKAGKYTLHIEYADKREITQDLSWGVLAINTDRSSYSPNETADIYMTVLDDIGETVCDAEVLLTITTPSRQKHAFSTNDDTIKLSPECAPKNFTYLPDFSVDYQIPNEIGEYFLTIQSTIDGDTREITEIMLVDPDQPYVITRTGPTRIYPPEKYQITLKIFAKEDFNGFISESAPSSFNLALPDLSHDPEINHDTDRQTISWHIDIQKNETITLKYIFQAPQISPEFYLLGPLHFINNNQKLIFTEPRSWHIAADPISGLIVAWPGTASSIPSGWSRVTALDNRYPKGVPNSSTNPGATGGSATHTHTVPAHTHVQNPHTHTGTTGSAPDSSACTNLASGGSFPNLNHTHDFTTDAATATNQNASVTLGASSNDPPFYTVIWISSNGTTNIPTNSVAYSYYIPSGWLLADGSSGTPNLINRYLKGAPSGNNGGATGGSSTHTHTNAAHNHVQNPHSHTGTTDWPVGGRSCWESFGTCSNPTDCPVYRWHTHSFTTNNTTATNNSSSINIHDASNDPPYKILIPIVNNTGSNNLPPGIILVWTGTLANIPPNWHLCDGSNGTPDLRNYFIKNSNSDYDDAGGSQGHNHTADPHTHTQSAHNHTGTTNAADPLKRDFRLAVGGYSGHSFTTNNTTATNQNTTITVNNNSDTRPPFYEVAYIQYIPPGPFRFEGVRMEGIKINQREELPELIREIIALAQKYIEIIASININFIAEAWSEK